MIKSEVIADSINHYGGRITTMVLTFPRIILAEFNTHRVISKNSASSRAIPTKKLIKNILDNPFVPIGWQKDHTGMQGSSYFDDNEKFDVSVIREYMFKRLQNMYRLSKDQDESSIVVDDRVLALYNSIFDEYKGAYTLSEFWLIIRTKVLQSVILLHCLGVTKQICNRLLEPFMYHTVICTFTEIENFFSLRCPQYLGDDGIFYRTKLECEYYSKLYTGVDNLTFDWRERNRGQSEIHIMALAECMCNSYRRSIPKLLTAGEWHIPFGDGIVVPMEGYEFATDVELDLFKVKVATARCARVSYTVVGDGQKADNYDSDISLHDGLIKSRHASPFEHPAKCMGNSEYYDNCIASDKNSTISGVSRNFSGGWLQYRDLLSL